MKKLKLPSLILISVLLTGCSDIADAIGALLTLFYVGLKWILIIAVVMLIIGLIGAMVNKK